MEVYIITFLISILFIALAQKNKNAKALYYLFVIIGLFIPCIIASLRDLSIGTDNLSYYNLFMKSQNYSFFDFVFIKSSGEILYYGLCWITSNLLNNYAIFSFLCQLLTILPIYWVLNKESEKSSTVLLGMTIYYLVVYNTSLNMIRQSISLSFIVLAFYMLSKHKFKNVIIFTLISVLFHFSAIISIPIYILYFILNSKISLFKKIIFEALIVLAFLFISIHYVEVLNVFFSIFNLKYIDYISGASSKIRTAGISLLTIIPWSFLTIIMTIFYKSFKSKTTDLRFYYFILIIILFSSYTNSFIAYSDRIFLYIQYPFYFLFLSKINDVIKVRNNRFIMTIVLLFFFFIMWFYTIVIMGYNETVPYLFK